MDKKSQQVTPGKMKRGLVAFLKWGSQELTCQNMVMLKVKRDASRGKSTSRDR